MSFGIWLGVGTGGSALIAMATWAVGHPRRITFRTVAATGWLWAAGVVGLTFGTRSGGGQAVNVALLDLNNAADRIDFLLNMTMFIPAGILLAAACVRFRTACAAGLLMSLAIETAQYLTGSGRTADINDLLANTGGCLVGYACTRVIAHVVTPHSAAAGNLGAQPDRRST